LPAPQLGDGIFIKPESLQRTGSFKLRGACAVLADGATGEVVTASAGNHGLGIAVAAGALGRRALVVVPASTPAVKRDGIRALGAALQVSGRGYDEAEAIARALARERGVPFISPYDDDAVIFGNGTTTAEEILADRPEVRQVIAPVGGGGLVAGLARAFAGSGVALVGVEPAANCGMAESLACGRALTEYRGGPTLCEGLEGAVAERTFEAARAAGVEMVLVSEVEVRRALAFSYRQLGLILEPSAAVVVAALRTGACVPARPAVAILTGSNIEPELLDAVLREEP
jgi:threonine dehydratase